MISATTRKLARCPPECFILQLTTPGHIPNISPTPSQSKESVCPQVVCHNTTPRPRGWTGARTRRETILHHHPSMAVAAATAIDRLLLPLTMPRPRRHQDMIPTPLLVIAATKEAAIPVTIGMIDTSPRAVRTTTRSLRDPRTRIPPSVALTRSDHLRAISTFARRSPEA